MDDPDLWQEAQDRVLLYLKKLGMPAVLSLEIARDALQKAAEEAPAAGSVRPLALAMRALHTILCDHTNLLENTPYTKYSILYRRWQRENHTMSASCTVTDPGTALQSAALPPINRGSMTIKRI